MSNILNMYQIYKMHSKSIMNILFITLSHTDLYNNIIKWWAKLIN